MVYLRFEYLVRVVWNLKEWSDGCYEQSVEDWDSIRRWKTADVVDVMGWLSTRNTDLTGPKKA